MGHMIESICPILKEWIKFQSKFMRAKIDFMPDEVYFIPKI